MHPCALKEKAQGLYFQWERMEDFKVRKEGVKEMTGVMEKIKNEGIEQSRNQIAENMVRLGFTSEQIAQATGLSAEKVAEIAKEIKN